MNLKINSKRQDCIIFDRMQSRLLDFYLLHLKHFMGSLHDCIADFLRSLDKFTSNPCVHIQFSFQVLMLV